MDFFINEDAYCYKQIVISDDIIYATSRLFNQSTFMDEFKNSPKSGISDLREVVKVEDIKKYTLIPIDKEIDIEYEDFEDEKDLNLTFKTNEDFKNASKLFEEIGLKGKKKKYGLKPTFYAISFTAFLGLVTYWLAQTAIEVKNGTFVPRGRRKWMDRLIAIIADFVGEIGIYIIGGILMLFFLYVTVAQFRFRNKEIEVFE